MPSKKPKTKAGKNRVVKNDMGKFAEGKLKSGSGATVTSRKQAVAISLSEAGIKKSKRKKK